jgi:mono/diheme cytochrome c family protein
LRDSTVIAVAGAMFGLTVTGCSESATNPLAERGRQVYLSQCTSCHAADPSQPGPIGPPVKGSARALLEARILRADYPAGYVPKRSTKIMPAQPQVATDIPALSEYLK